MDWIPTNKATGKTYPPVSDAEKKRLETSPHTSGKYSFSPVKSAAKPITAPEQKKPTEQKKEPVKAEDPTKTE